MINARWAIATVCISGIAAISRADERQATGCSSELALHAVRPLDFGDVRIPAQQSAFLAISPQGQFVNSANVLVVRAPSAGELDLCGPGQQRFAIMIEEPRPLKVSGKNSALPRAVIELSVEADSVMLERTEPGRWEGKMPLSGRSTVRIGATIYYASGGAHGPATANLDIQVVAQ